MPSLQSQTEAARIHLKGAFDDARAKNGKNGRKKLMPKTLLMERNTAVLWGLYHGWSDEEISNTYHEPPPTDQVE